MSDIVVEPLTQKWVVHFKNPDGTDNMGMCNTYHALPNMITAILTGLKGKNIVIKDESIYFNSEGEAID